MESLFCLYGVATGVLLTLMVHFIKRFCAEIREAGGHSADIQSMSPLVQKKK